MQSRPLKHPLSSSPISKPTLTVQRRFHQAHGFKELHAGARLRLQEDLSSLLLQFSLKEHKKVGQEADSAADQNQ